MKKRLREEIWEVVVEGGTDILYMSMDLIAAPFMAICRVVSDFIHGKGRYDHSDRGSHRTR